MIGGNVVAILQQKDAYAVNAIGERVYAWKEIKRVYGWLDLSGGDSKRTYDTKLQESTHVFLCDYLPIDRNAADKRMIIKGNIYEVLLIDDPMELNQHIEISLKYIGGDSNG